MKPCIQNSAGDKAVAIWMTALLTSRRVVGRTDYKWSGCDIHLSSWLHLAIHEFAKTSEYTETCWILHSLSISTQHSKLKANTTMSKAVRCLRRQMDYVRNTEGVLWTWHFIVAQRHSWNAQGRLPEASFKALSFQLREKDYDSARRFPLWAIAFHRKKNQCSMHATQMLQTFVDLRLLGQILIFIFVKDLMLALALPINLMD